MTSTTWRKASLEKWNLAWSLKNEKELAVQKDQFIIFLVNMLELLG